MNQLTAVNHLLPVNKQIVLNLNLNYISNSTQDISSILPAICSKIALDHHQNGFCEEYKACDHLHCICLHKETSTIAPNIIAKITKTEPQAIFTIFGWLIIINV